MRTAGMLPNVIVQNGLITAKSNSHKAKQASYFFTTTAQHRAATGNQRAEGDERYMGIIDESYKSIAYLKATLGEILEFAKIHLGS